MVSRGDKIYGFNQHLWGGFMVHRGKLLFVVSTTELPSRRSVVNWIFPTLSILPFPFLLITPPQDFINHTEIDSSEKWKFLVYICSSALKANDKNSSICLTFFLSLDNERWPSRAIESVIEYNFEYHSVCNSPVRHLSWGYHWRKICTKKLLYYSYYQTVLIFSILCTKLLILLSRAFSICISWGFFEYDRKIAFGLFCIKWQQSCKVVYFFPSNT